MSEEECPIPPELKKSPPYRIRFSPVKGYPKEAFSGWVMERVFYSEKTPFGYWYPIIDYLKFDDGSHALRFWYEKWDKKTGKFAMARGMFLRENDIEELKKRIDKTLAIKTLLRKFFE